MWWRRTLNWAPMSTALCAASVLVMTVGCARIEVIGPEHLHGQQFAAETKPVAHIYGNIWGWYLFEYIPIVTGNLDDPEIPQWPKFFTDNVQVDVLVDKITERSQEIGGTISDLTVRTRSSWEPITLIFWLNEYEVSANVSRLEGEGELPRTNQKAR